MDMATIVKHAKKDMLRQGYHQPTLYLEDSKGSYQKQLNFLPDTTLEKEQLLFSIGHDLAMEHDIEAREVQQLVWVCEAWFTKVPVEEAEYTPRPSQDPRRQEALMVLTLTIEEQRLAQRMQIMEVIRHGTLIDLLPHREPHEVKSMLLPSCLAGVVAASLTESELDEIVGKYLHKGEDDS